MSPRTLTDEELIRHIELDNSATERERALAERLAHARDCIHDMQEFLIEHNLAEFETVFLQ